MSGEVRRIRRDASLLESLDLFSRLDNSTREIRLNHPDRVESFISQLRNGLNTALASKSRLHGWRTQSLFQTMVSSLGQVSFLKEEDVGDCFFTGEDLKVPDFRLVLEDGSSMLVEVKNKHQTPSKPTAYFSMSAGELGALERYCRVASGGSIKVAVYWSLWNQWTLVPPGAFSIKSGRARLPMSTAFKANQMAVFGDFKIGAIPPIEIRFENETPSDIDDKGLAELTIGAVNVSCGHTDLSDPKERNLAWLFLQYGQWDKEMVPNISGGRLEAITLRAEPEQMSHESQPFEIVGSLSSFVSSHFNMATMSEEGEILSLRSHNPFNLSGLVPDDYKSESLPLWRFYQEPNLSSD